MIAIVLSVLCAAIVLAAKCTIIAVAISLLDRCLTASSPPDSIPRRLFVIIAVIGYPAYVVATWAVVVFAVLCVNWWAVLLADDDGNLPSWLRWFQTFDASIDAGWRDGYFPTEWGETPRMRYLARVLWLLRNPAYGLDYWLFGLTFDARGWRVLANIERDDLVLFFAVGNGVNLYYHGPLGEAKIGWKAWNYWLGNAWRETPWGPAWQIPVCATYNPFKRRVSAA
ncbi:hypothetical protein HUS70_13870 [Pandoraea nosoerga]|uniref:Uncharacterized protein n=1 Tax=Pandoraea nosoerga TaxID=2508296 RepID=A0A5E4V1D6_9BURK|nr:hypothetical protein [Pandoraea nosoerga]MBN4667885.1 hypothetical protein [Pandoraea nosoerga]MBN4676510.1 hypothetical protein [Pandoraea nosoerga]MBN4682833.1 hypothetical protein [Pandoraea nosoerga]MBN4745710.1 hypothetical protein [Pandoraea nosoerga]VVE05603.1 hypothetical protein PNO31109_02350 [Pandoraea nosoerga]